MRGIGLDLLDARRMERPMGNPHFMERVFTPEEREYLEHRGSGGTNAASKSGVLSAAGMFCAKEAVSKALGIGLLRVPFHAIEIGHTASGQPVARLHPPICADGRIHLSITHTGSMAAAVAVWED